MERKLYVIITAGGVGRRMGGNIAKQFLEIGGKPILLRTINFFLESPLKPEILLVLPRDYKEYWKEYCTKNSLWFSHRLVDGGITRFHSVKNALKYIPDGALVMVHDGVRPFLDNEMMKRLLCVDLQADEKVAGVIPVLPMVDSMREIIGEGQTKIVARERFLMVQTPQLFETTKLKRAYEQAYTPLFTDDASVVEGAGYSVATVEGSRMNIKITTPEDLKIGAAILNLLNLTE